MIINCLQQPQLSSLIAKGASQLLEQLKQRPDLSLFGSNWPDLGHVPTTEPVSPWSPAATCFTHAGREDWEHSGSESPKWAADRRGENGCCGDRMLGVGVD